MDILSLCLHIIYVTASLGNPANLRGVTGLSTQGAVNRLMNDLHAIVFDREIDIQLVEDQHKFMKALSDAGLMDLE